MDSQTTNPFHLNLNQVLPVRRPSACLGNRTGNKAMERFQEFIMNLAETRPNPVLTPARKALLQDRLNRLISNYKTPDHPPYSAMIERAIKELREKEGSTEEAISEFISKEYDDLPQAHSTFLRHHLGKLSEYGHIAMTWDERYMLPEESSLISNTKPKKKKKLKRKSRWAWEGDSYKQHKKGKKKGYKVDSVEELMVFDKQKQLAENCVSGKEKQNKGMMSGNELECLMNLLSHRRDVDAPELIGGVSFAHSKEKLEGEQAKDVQSELFSPEMPPGFESIITDNLLHAENLLDKDSSPKEQSITVGGEELLGSHLSIQKFDAPTDPSDYELPKSDVVKNFQYSHDDRRIERLEHQPATAVQASLTNDTFKEASLEKMELAVVNVIEVCCKKEKWQWQEEKSFQNAEMATEDVATSSEQVKIKQLQDLSAVKHSGLEESRRFSNSKLDLSISEVAPSGSPESADDLSQFQSMRMRKQLRRWSLPGPTSVNSRDLAACSKQDHHVLQPDKEKRELQKADALEVEGSVGTERKHKEIKKYFRRNKGNLNDNGVPFKMFPGLESPIELPNRNGLMPCTSLVSSKELPKVMSPLSLQQCEFQCMNDKEPQGPLQLPDVPGKDYFEDPSSQMIPSFPLSKTDAESMHPMLPQPEECQQKPPKRRGRPPKPKPCADESKGSFDSVHLGMEVFKPLRRRSQRLLLALKF